MSSTRNRHFGPFSLPLLPSHLTSYSPYYFICIVCMRFSNFKPSFFVPFFLAHLSPSLYKRGFLDMLLVLIRLNFCAIIILTHFAPSSFMCVWSNPLTFPPTFLHFPISSIRAWSEVICISPYYENTLWIYIISSLDRFPTSVSRPINILCILRRWSTFLRTLSKLCLIPVHLEPDAVLASLCMYCVTAT